MGDKPAGCNTQVAVLARFSLIFIDKSYQALLGIMAANDSGSTRIAIYTVTTAIGTGDIVEQPLLGRKLSPLKVL